MRKTADAAAEEGEFQTAADTTNGLGGGQPLPASVRNFFEPRFGYDFGHVRVHTGGLAGDRARDLNALAYTSGRDIVFGEGQYAPATTEGRRLLGHELTHVVQQDSGSMPGTVQRETPPDTAYYDPFTKDPKRGFKPEDLARLTASGDKLTFEGSLSPLSAELQTMLLENITATIRFALDPNDPTRVAELKVLKDYLDANPKVGPFFDKPAERLDYSDLYHGHICMPQPVKSDLTKLGKPVLDKEEAIKAAIREKIGTKTPTTRGEAKQVMSVAEGDERQKYLDALAPLLQALKDLPEAGVVYHSREGTQSKPVVGGKRVDTTTHPGRTIFTPLSNHKPKFLLKDDPHCEALANFTFHVDQKGHIMLLPGAYSEMERAYEILHDALVPTAPPLEETPAETTETPAKKRWSISAAAGGDVTPDAQRLAFALGGRYSIHADEALIFNPAIGFNLVYLPSSSFNASHLIAATADLTARIQQPLSGFYFDVSAGGFAGFDIDPKRDPTAGFTGGFTGALGAGYRTKHVDFGAEARALVPGGGDFDHNNVLVFGRAAWRFEEVKKPKR